MICPVLLRNVLRRIRKVEWRAVLAWILIKLYSIRPRRYWVRWRGILFKGSDLLGRWFFWIFLRVFFVSIRNTHYNIYDIKNMSAHKHNPKIIYLIADQSSDLTYLYQKFNLAPTDE